VHIDKNIAVNVPELAKRLFFICSPQFILWKLFGVGSLLEFLLPDVHHLTVVNLLGDEKQRENREKTNEALLFGSN